MGNPIIGRYASVRMGAVKILNLASWDMNLATDEIDASVFGTGFGATMPGIQKWTVAVAGFYDPTDSTGQNVILAAKLNATKLTNIRFYVDNTSYFTPDLTNDPNAGAYITSYAVKTDKSGLAALTFNVVGVGMISSLIAGA
jgi:hypothetical protein